MTMPLLGSAARKLRFAKVSSAGKKRSSARFIPYSTNHHKSYGLNPRILCKATASRPPGKISGLISHDLWLYCQKHANQASIL